MLIVTFAFVSFRFLGTLPVWAAFGVHSLVPAVVESHE